MNRAVISVFTLCVVGAGAIGCESSAGNGALIGGGTGAGIGAIIGHQSGKTGQGALIGGAIGAIGGGLVGNEVDKKDRREREQYDDRYYEARTSRASRDGRYESRSSALTKEEVIRWSERGDREDVIVDRVERSGTVFHLSARDENQLRDHGVSEDVIRAMKDTARR